MSDAEKTLREWIYACRGQHSDLEAAQAMLTAALSSARAEALEEAAQCYEAWAAENCQTDSPTPEKRIRALITTPATATIPVERLLKAMDTAWMSTRQKRELLTDLGVDLDAKGEATSPDATCARCHLPHREDGTSYREEDGIGILCRSFLHRRAP